MKKLSFRKKTVFSILVSVVFLALFTSIVQAAVAFSYEGWGIRSRASLGSTYLNSTQTVTIKHRQRRDYHRNGVGLTVTIQKHNGWTWTSVGSHTFYETTSGSFSRRLSSGTYRLYFSTTARSGQTYYINGTFNK